MAISAWRSVQGQENGNLNPLSTGYIQASAQRQAQQHQQAAAAAQTAAATQQTKQAGATLSWSRLQTVGKGLVKGAVAAVVRPVVDIATGQGGKAVHDASQLTSDVSGGQINQFAAGVKQVPKGIAADIAAGSNNPAVRAQGIQAQKEAQQSAYKTNDSGTIAKKIIGSTVGTAAMFVGGGAAKGAIAGEKVAQTAGKDIISKAATAIKGNAKLSTAAAAGNAATTLSNKPDASGKELATSALQGYSAGLGLGAIGKVFKAGSQAALDKVKAKNALSPEAASAEFKSTGGKTAAQINVDQYHNPELSAPKAPKTIARETTPAGKTTGGLSTTKTAKALATVPDGAVVHTSEGKMAVAKDTTPRDVHGVPTGQPSGTRTAGLATNVEKKAIEKNLTSGFGDLPEYHTINMKEQASLAADLVSNDRPKALAVARGDESAPPGLKALSVHQALQHQAIKEGDAETLRHLSQSKLTVKTSEGAQDLRILRERDPNDPVAAMKDIADKRAAKFEKQSGKKADKAITEEAGKYKTAIASATKAPSKDEWKMFLESIRC